MPRPELRTAALALTGMELRRPLERLEDTRSAPAAGDVDEARRVLANLSRQLESIFFRGELVLEGSGLDAR